MIYGNELKTKIENNEEPCLMNKIEKQFNYLTSNDQQEHNDTLLKIYEKKIDDSAINEINLKKQLDIYTTRCLKDQLENILLLRRLNDIIDNNKQEKMVLINQNSQLQEIYNQKSIDFDNLNLKFQQLEIDFENLKEASKATIDAQLKEFEEFQNESKTTIDGLIQFLDLEKNSNNDYKLKTIELNNKLDNSQSLLNLERQKKDDLKLEISDLKKILNTKNIETEKEIQNLKSQNSKLIEENDVFNKIKKLIN